MFYLGHEHDRRIRLVDRNLEFCLESSLGIALGTGLHRSDRSGPGPGRTAVPVQRPDRKTGITYTRRSVYVAVQQYRMNVRPMFYVPMYSELRQANR